MRASTFIALALFFAACSFVQSKKEGSEIAPDWNPLWGVGPVVVDDPDVFGPRPTSGRRGPRPSGRRGPRPSGRKNFDTQTTTTTETDAAGDETTTVTTTTETFSETETGSVDTVASVETDDSVETVDSVDSVETEDSSETTESVEEDQAEFDEEFEDQFQQFEDQVDGLPDRHRPTHGPRPSHRPRPTRGPRPSHRPRPTRGPRPSHHRHPTRRDERQGFDRAFVAPKFFDQKRPTGRRFDGDDNKFKRPTIRRPLLVEGFRPKIGIPIWDTPDFKRPTWGPGGRPTRRDDGGASRRFGGTRRQKRNLKKRTN